MENSMHTMFENFYLSDVFKKMGRDNYIPCLRVFEKYCSETYRNHTTKEIFDNLLLYDVEESCKIYFETSNKAEGVEAIRRFLSAIDFMYGQYLKTIGIHCQCIEAGCRKKEIVDRICGSINKDVNNTIYIPISEAAEIKVAQLADSLKDDKFYSYGQKLIYKLLVNYGLKSRIILSMPLDAFDEISGTLTYVAVKGEAPISLELSEELKEMFLRYIKMQRFREREWMFTNSKGRKLYTNNIIDTLQSKIAREGLKNVSAISISLRGIEKLLEKGLMVSEIKRISGFTTKKIVEVSEYMIYGKDINQEINMKLKN